MNETVLGIIIGALFATTAWLFAKNAKSRRNDKFRDCSRVESELDGIIKENADSREQLKQSVATATELKVSISELGEAIRRTESTIERTRSELETDEQTTDRVSKLFTELSRRAEQDDI